MEEYGDYEDSRMESKIYQNELSQSKPAVKCKKEEPSVMM